jgi:hypothetical protein
MLEQSKMIIVPSEVDVYWYSLYEITSACCRGKHYNIAVVVF